MARVTRMHAARRLAAWSGRLAEMAAYTAVADSWGVGASMDYCDQLDALLLGGNFGKSIEIGGNSWWIPPQFDPKDDTWR